MERKIPRKNYIIYSIIVIITISLVMYLNEWYKAYKSNELTNSYISQYINEINYEEFENLTLENTNIIVYVGEKNSEKCIKLEKDLYKIIKKYSLKDETVFLNVTDIDNINKITNKYNIDNLKTNLNVPSIAIIKDSKITDILNSDENNEIKNDLIIQLLEEYEYIK